MGVPLRRTVSRNSGKKVYCYVCSRKHLAGEAVSLRLLAMVGGGLASVAALAAACFPLSRKKKEAPQQVESGTGGGSRRSSLELVKEVCHRSVARAAAAPRLSWLLDASSSRSRLM